MTDYGDRREDIRKAIAQQEKDREAGDDATMPPMVPRLGMTGDHRIPTGAGPTSKIVIKRR